MWHTYARMRAHARMHIFQLMTPLDMYILKMFPKQKNSNKVENHKFLKLEIFI